MEKIIQITAGRGPAECSWVVAQVLKLFLQETRVEGFQYRILHSEKGTQNGTIQSVTIHLTGARLDAFMATWLGTIQWIGSSIFRKHHKRKNWFIGAFELNMINPTKVNECDISFQTMRSTGPGGQHVNKVNSAVRAIHKPTGIQVVAMDRRSQHQNKKLAIARLEEKVNDSEHPFLGYWDAVSWVKENYDQEINYQTLRSYLIRNFKTKKKHPRKYIIKKT